jgi:hypothetical protein
LAALEEVNNTFFVENLSSNDEENISDNLNHEDNNDIDNLNEDFNEMRLSNFEFVENPNNFIEDEVHNELKLKVEEIFRSGQCSCSSSCYEKIGYKRFLTRRMEFESLNKNMHDMVIKEQLLAFQQDENTKKVNASNRKFLRFKYCFNNSFPICCTTYQNLTSVGHSYLDNVIKHFREYGLEERTHGNTGRAPKNMKRIEVNYSVACEIYNFLNNYLDIHSLPLLGRNFNKVSIPVIFLPTSFSYASVYRDYVQSFKDQYGEEACILCKTTFRDTWKVLMPSLQFMLLKSDLCEICKTMKLEIQYATKHEKKVAVTEKYLVYLDRAKQEREYYNTNIKQAVEDGKRNPNKIGSQILFKSFENMAYIMFNWAQNVQILYSSQQIGALLFKSP